MTKYFKHESAYVDEGAVIGEGTKIWHFCHIMPKAQIGHHCSLGQNVFVADHAVIGNHVKIQNNVSVYAKVTLEDYVFCGPSMTFTNIKIPRSAYPRNDIEDYIPTRVCRGASLGAHATVVCGVTIGAWALVGSGSVVTHDVPPYALMVGVPARQVGWACECGTRLDFAEGAKQTTCVACGKHYMYIEAGAAEFGKAITRIE
jgi:UDP-2-acetamido-3-amino-2,3-dideoxy-glucuronate N-acetyltransferase